MAPRGPTQRSSAYQLTLAGSIFSRLIRAKLRRVNWPDMAQAVVKAKIVGDVAEGNGLYAAKRERVRIHLAPKDESMEKSGFSEHLDNIWKESGRDMAVSFLQRALRTEMTLADLQRALSFDGVTSHLNEIQLADVLTAKARQVEPAARAVPAPAPRRAVGRPRRQRRSSDEMRQIRQTLHDLILAEPGSLDTVQLVELLAERSHEVDTIIVNSMLKTLQEEGKIVTLGGKPKSWRKAGGPGQTGGPTIRRNS